MLLTENLSMENLDNTDLAILRLLQKDSNITIKELASHINLSPTPIYERVKKLENNGFIKKYSAILDKDKLGLDLTVFCNVSLKQHTSTIGKKFVKDIMGIKEVVECYNISGDYDFLLKVLVKDMPHYQEFVLNVLGNVESIGSAHSIFVMGEIKHSYEISI